ncbi:helix-turn-helix domain-containing protein [Chryseobacterium nepalense]|uniref:Helix-turn-helix domain-containing protein n=1 Tax=Chryseobacterium nepalense TaxID=1854498 RepID=A0ABY4K8I2_9FLAO|nr:helix-turn-helix domain-containing protein [Chryseobacterium nepalense]UPQ77090.1 helix-turn-helix domain-containing protein [Chryseobacterium nepalense]
MEVNKICQFCGNRFVAKRTTTQCCSDDCAKKFYKKRKRDEKIQASDKGLEVQIKGYDIEEIQKKDYLSIKEVMLLLNISRTSIYRMLKDGRLSKLEGFKSVRIRKVDLDLLFKQKVENNEEKQYNLPYFCDDNYYTINEVLDVFKVSSGSFYHLCNKHNVPKIPKGKNVYVPKNLVNTIFNNE